MWHALLPVSMQTKSCGCACCSSVSVIQLIDWLLARLDCFSSKGSWEITTWRNEPEHSQRATFSTLVRSLRVSNLAAGHVLLWYNSSPWSLAMDMCWTKATWRKTARRPICARSVCTTFGTKGDESERPERGESWKISVVFCTSLRKPFMKSHRLRCQFDGWKSYSRVEELQTTVPVWEWKWLQTSRLKARRGGQTQ